MNPRIPKTLLALCILSAPAILPAMPRIIREVLETNTLYLSAPVSRTVLTGGVARITNHISRRGYNVAGKIVKIRVIPDEAGLLSVEGTAPVEEPDLASVYETGDRPGPDPVENADRAAANRTENPVAEGPAVQGKTDIYGRITFLFRPRPGLRGPVDLQVYFVNQTTGFAEQTLVHRLEVVSRPLALLESAITAIALFAVLLLAFLGQRATWRPDAPHWEDVLLPWTTLLIPSRTRGDQRLKSLWISVLAGVAMTTILSLMPNPVWGLGVALGLALAAAFRRSTSSHPTLLFISIALWWAALGNSLSQPFAVAASLLPEGSWVPWSLGPALAFLAPNPVLSFPLLYHGATTGLLTPLQAALGLIPLVAGALWVWFRKKA